MSDSKPPSTLKQALGLDDLAVVVREQHQIVVGAAHGMLNAATAAGDALIAAHNEISHGEWGRWLREDCLNERTARRYVQLAENRGWFEANRSCATNLTIADALRLLDNRQRPKSTGGSTTSTPFSSKTWCIVTGFTPVRGNSHCICGAELHPLELALGRGRYGRVWLHSMLGFTESASAPSMINVGRFDWSDP